MIWKLFRFVRNPRPYLKKMWFNWWISPFVWPIQVWIYRYILLGRLVKRCKKQEPITVLFLAMSVSYWKYDTLYRRMARDARFRPIIMPAMRTNQTLEEQLRDHDELMDEFSRRGYNIVSGYDRATGKFRDARLLRPDIVFYAHPYSGSGRLRKQYDFWAMRGSLICYASYFFPNENDAFYLNHPIQNTAWQLYYAYEQLLPLTRKVMDNGGINVKITGYAFAEDLSECSEEAADRAWKNDSSGRKRIIWAPHHSIAATDTVARTSTFLEYCEYMKNLTIRYKDRLLITFKPHPVLYSRLLNEWGKSKVDAYYAFWQEQENTQLQTGGYVDLFKGSDALIHDSGSFKCEYLYMDKPCMFLFRKDFLKDVNEVGKSSLSAHYEGYSRADIEAFIENVVIGGIDPKAEERRRFRDVYLKSPNGKMFSENVVEEIITGLGEA